MSLHHSDPIPNNIHQETSTTNATNKRASRYAAAKRRRQAEARRREEISEAAALGVQIAQPPRLDMRWTEEEYDVLRKLYPDYKAMQKCLPHRGYSAIRTKVRNTGLQAPRPSAAVWTAAQTTILRRIYSRVSVKELREAFPDKTLVQIHQRAINEGVRRPKKALEPTGIPIIDAIRERARELNYTMQDLDKIACTGNFFLCRRWTRKSKNSEFYHGYVKIGRAVAALGGTLTVDWGSYEN